MDPRTNPNDSPERDALLSERMLRSLDRLSARLDGMDERLAHLDELLGLRLAALERTGADQEARLRRTSEEVVRLAAVTSLAQAGQAAFSLALTAVAAWLGRR